MARAPVIERDVDPVFVDFHEEGVELRIGRPIDMATGGIVPSLLARGASLFALLTPAEARIVAHELLAAAERGSVSS